MEESLIEEKEINNETEVSPALIAVHPLEKSVAVAIGSELRIFDLQEDSTSSLGDDSGGPLHSDSTRAISFGANGRLFASAGDDKLVKIWGTNPWQCIRTVGSLQMEGSFLALIEISKYVLRSSPRAHEIQSFCLGHTEFVSCLSFVCTEEYPQGFLVSGGGDSTVRLWDITSGSLLDTCEVGIGAGLLESNGEEEICPAITDICASPNGYIVAVSIQSLHGIVLLSCDLSATSLSITKVVSVGETFIPTSLSMSSSAERVWMVTGASNLPTLDFPSFTRLRIISRLKKCGSDSSVLEPVVVEENQIPGGLKLLEKLQGSVSTGKEDESLAAAADAVKAAMRNLMIKRQYSVEKLELRKKRRNDRKLKQ